MLLFGNEGAKSKKGRKPSSGHRQLRADYDPNKETKGPSPSSMFIPAHQEPEGLRLPRLPTPDSRFQEDKTTRDSLRPMQEALQPLHTHRGAFTHREGGPDGAENRHENRARPGSSSPEVSAIMQGTPGRTKAYEEGDSRAEGTSSRVDGRAWEDSDYDNPKDPILNGFREVRLQVQVMQKKDPGTKEFKAEQKALETRLKRLESQVMSDRQALMRRSKSAKTDTTSLQNNLKMARDNMHATMQQAADDVVALTQKLQDVEDKYAQCRVDKDHLERSFASEMDVLRKKNADTEQRLEAAHRQHEELAERMREDREEARKNKRAKNEAESSVRALEEQLDVATRELVELKTGRSQLERQVMQLQGDVQMQKANVRNEEDRVKMEKERNNERVRSLESQLERCMEETAALEDYKAEANDARRKLEQAEGLLDEAEAVRKEAVKAAQVTCQTEKEEALARAAKELETVKRQLTNAISDKSDAAQRASQAHAQLQADLQAANNKLSEANKERVAAQEKLKKETDAMLEQLKRAQNDSARNIKVAGEAKEEVLQCKEKAQEAELELKEQLVGLRLKTQELTFTNTELEASLERCRKDLTVCNGKLQEASELLASSTAQSDLDALKKIIREKDDYISELKRTIEEGEQRVAREREALRKARDALYESQRKTEEVEEMIPRLQAEKEVFQGMVHQLMSQLSKARMDKMSVLKAGEGMSVQEQHAHLQQLLMSAKNHSQQVASLIERVPTAKQEAVKKYMTDLESSRASSRQSMAPGDEDPRMADLAAFSRDPSRAPSTTKVGPAEAALQMDNEAVAAPEMASAPSPQASPADTAAATEEAATAATGGAVAAAPAEEQEGTMHDESNAAAQDAAAPDAGAATASRPMTAASAASAGAGEAPTLEGGGSRAASVAAGGTQAEPAADRHVGGGEGSEETEEDKTAQDGPASALPEGDESAQQAAASEAPSEWGADAEAAAVRIQAVARGGRDRAQVREYLEGQMADYLAANPDAVAHEGGGEQEAAAEQDAGATNSAQQDAVQARDEFVRPTPPTSRPTSRPASSSIRRPGGSKTGSRVGSPAPGASGSRPASATVPPA